MTIRPLSSRVIFVAPRNMTRQGESRPFPPTFSHWAPLWNRGRTMSIQNSEKFVAFTKTYVEALMSGTTVSQSREAHSVLTISGLPNELYTVVRRKLRRCGASGLERMLDPLDARRGAVRIPHHDDVEAHRQLRQLRTLLQRLRQAERIEAEGEQPAALRAAAGPRLAGGGVHRIRQIPSQHPRHVRKHQAIELLVGAHVRLEGVRGRVGGNVAGVMKAQLRPQQPL